MGRGTAQSSGWRILGTVVLVMLSACTSGGADGNDGDDAVSGTTTTTTSTITTTAEKPAVDPDLSTRTITVRGAPVVGEALTAEISSDLEGRIQSWGWHRCVRIPACQTVSGARSHAYTPTVDDAWQVMRVIAVAERDGRSPGAVSLVVGPVTNPDPAPFSHSQTIDASQPTGLRLIVAPGRVQVGVDAACPVLVVAGIRTPTPDEAAVTAEHTSEDEAAQHDIVLDGEGGELTVGVVGECDGVTVTVDAAR